MCISYDTGAIFENENFIHDNFLFQLLLFISGSRDRYREIRDLYSIEKNLNAVIEQCNKNGLSTTEVAPHSVVLPYDSLLVLVSMMYLAKFLGTRDEPCRRKPLHD